MQKENKKEKLIPLTEASKVSGYARGHLNFLARNGILKAQKLGNNWFTTEAWLDELILKKETENGDLITLAEASKISGYARGHLNLLARTGELKAEKVGRNWHTKKGWVKEMIKQKELEKEIENVRRSNLMKSKTELPKNISKQALRASSLRLLEPKEPKSDRDERIEFNLEKLNGQISRLSFKPKREMSFAQATFLMVLLIGAMFLYKSEKNYIVEKFKGNNVAQIENEDNVKTIAGEETERIISRNDVDWMTLISPTIYM